MPRTIAAVISAKLASLHELQTVYGVEDVYDMLEVAAVQVHNHNAAMKRQKP